MKPLNNSEEIENESLLQQIMKLELIGEYITTFIALIPAFFLLLIRIYIFKINEDIGGWYALFLGVVTIYWLLFLEKKGKVIITTPHIPIPIKWIIPFLVILYVISYPF